MFDEIPENQDKITEDPKIFRQFKKFLETQIEFETRDLNNNQKNEIKNYIRYCPTWQELLLVLNVTYEKFKVQIDLQKSIGSFEVWQQRRLKNDIKQKTLMLLIQRKREKATELLVDHILENEIIYTTREDKVPEVWIYKGGIFTPQGRTYIQEYCREILGEAYTTQFCNQVISKIEADTYIEQEEFFKEEDPFLIPVINGILNIKKNELLPFTPEYRFFNKLPIEYDPKADCPNIKTFFGSIFNHQADIDCMQEIFGYCLYRDNIIEKSMMLHGYGRNGKTKTLSLLKTFLGIENCISISLEELENQQFSKARLHRKLANIHGDLSRKAIVTAGTFKQSTGRDSITADRKFQSEITFTPYAKQIYAANELPITYDISEGFWSKWLILDYQNRFYTEQTTKQMYEEEKKKNPGLTYEKFKADNNIKLQDQDILQKLVTQQELNGLLNWALEGLNRLLKHRDFTISQTGIEVQNMWLRRSASINGFILDCVEQDWEEHVEKTEFKKAYSKYCKKNKFTMCSDKLIRRSLNTMVGIDEDRITEGHQQIRVWDGIKFKEEDKSEEKKKKLEGLKGYVEEQIDYQEGEQ